MGPFTSAGNPDSIAGEPNSHGSLGNVEIYRLLRDDWVEGSGGVIGLDGGGASWDARFYPKTAASEWALGGALGAIDTAGPSVVLGVAQHSQLESGVNVTADVQTWLDNGRTEQLGWMLRSDNPTISFRAWRSYDHPNSPGPQLALTYEVPATEQTCAEFSDAVTAELCGQLAGGASTSLEALRDEITDLIDLRLTEVYITDQCERDCRTALLSLLTGF